MGSKIAFWVARWQKGGKLKKDLATRELATRNGKNGVFIHNTCHLATLATQSLQNVDI